MPNNFLACLLTVISQKEEVLTEGAAGLKLILNIREGDLVRWISQGIWEKKS